MKRLAITAAVAATFAMGTIAQACPYHEHHSTRVRTSNVRTVPDRYYTADYGYTPGYSNYYAPAYNYGYSYGPGYGWDSGGYVNNYSTMGIGIGPYSIGF